MYAPFGIVAAKGTAADGPGATWLAELKSTPSAAAPTVPRFRTTVPASPKTYHRRGAGHGIELEEAVKVAEAVRLAVTDGDARDAVREADRDALPLREKLPVDGKDGEAAREALALPDAERDGEAMRDAEPDALALRDAVGDGEAWRALITTRPSFVAAATPGTQNGDAVPGEMYGAQGGASSPEALARFAMREEPPPPQLFPPPPPPKKPPPPPEKYAT